MASTDYVNLAPAVDEEEEKKALAKRQGAGQQQAVTNLPYQQYNQQTPLSPTVAGMYNYQDFVNPQQTKDLISNVQQQATNMQPGMLTDVQAMSKKLVNDPTMGKNYDQYKQQQVDKYNIEQQQAAEAARRNTGGIASTGGNIFDNLANQLTIGRGRRDLEIGLDEQAQKDQYDKYISALGQARDTATQEQAFSQGKITSGIAAAQAGVPYAQIGSQEKQQATQLQAQKELQEKALSSSEKIAFANLSVEEKKLAQQANQFTSELDFKKWATQTGLDDASAARIWQSTENAKKIASEEKMNASGLAMQEKLAYLSSDTQKAVVELQGKINKGLLVDKQEWDAAQSNLDRELQKALQEGDTQKAYNLQKYQQEFDAAQNKSQQEWTSAERIATQSWGTNERVSDQDFQKSMQYLDQQNKIALQNGDIEGQKTIAGMKITADMQMQMQGFTQEEKIQKLQNEFEKSIKDGDFEKQKAIIGIQFSQQLQVLSKEQGFAQAMKTSDQNFETQLTNLKANLEKQGIQFTKEMEAQLWNQQNSVKFQQDLQMFDKNATIEKMKIALEEKGINNAKLQQDFENLMDAGKEKEAMDLLKTSLPPDIAKGITSEKDPLAWKKAADEDYLMSQYQFAQTHPGAAKTDKNGNFVGLNDDYTKAFNDYINQQMWITPKDETGTTEGVDLTLIADIKNGNTSKGFTGEDDKNYQYVLKNSSALSPSLENSNINGVQKVIIKGMPSTGGFFNYDGQVYQNVSGGWQNSTSKIEHKVKNVLTGEIKTIYIGINGDSNIAETLTKPVSPPTPPRPPITPNTGGGSTGGGTGGTPY